MPSRITLLPHTPHPHDRQAAALQLLGRLEFLPVRHIHSLICPDLSRRGAQRLLDDLHAQGLIWRCAIPPEYLPPINHASPGNLPPVAPYLYGLTPEGHAWLATHDLEHPPLLDTFVVRDWAQPELKLGQLAHDLLVVDWCCSALAGLRACPAVAAVRCEVEFTSIRDRKGRHLQRFDALLDVAIAPQSRTPRTEPPWSIPWHGTLTRDARLLAWAVEVDRSTEKLITLLGKAVMYRDLTISGYYRRTIGLDPLPVILTPTRRRAQQIGREWLDGWPGGRGVISTFAAATDSPYGVLWGRYKTLGENPARDTTLWTDANITQTQWDAWMQPQTT